MPLVILIARAAGGGRRRGATGGGGGVCAVGSNRDRQDESHRRRGQEKTSFLGHHKAPLFSANDTRMPVCCLHGALTPRILLAYSRLSAVTYPSSPPMAFFGRPRPMLKLAPLILRNVMRNRRRTLLTLASTAVSLGLLALLLNIYQASSLRPTPPPPKPCAWSAATRSPSSSPCLAAQKQQIAAIPGVRLVSAYSWFQGTYKEPSNFFARIGRRCRHHLRHLQGMGNPPRPARRLQKAPHRLRPRCPHRPPIQYQARRHRHHRRRHLPRHPRTQGRRHLHRPRRLRVPRLPP